MEAPKYFVKGTIAVKVDTEETKISITPCAGFVTPDKKHVIAFSVTTGGDAKLIELLGGSFECDVAPIKNHISSLLTIAAQQKSTEIRIEITTNRKQKVTGFTFPAPTDYAHGR
jgi:hypothetical protein